MTTIYPPRQLQAMQLYARFCRLARPIDMERLFFAAEWNGVSPAEYVLQVFEAAEAARLREGES